MRLEVVSSNLSQKIFCVILEEPLVPLSGYQFKKPVPMTFFLVVDVPMYLELFHSIHGMFHGALDCRMIYMYEMFYCIIRIVLIVFMRCTVTYSRLSA